MQVTKANASHIKVLTIKGKQDTLVRNMVKTEEGTYKRMAESRLLHFNLG